MPLECDYQIRLLIVIYIKSKPEVFLCNNRIKSIVTPKTKPNKINKVSNMCCIRDGKWQKMLDQ